MDSFAMFIKKNKDVIKKISENNIKRNNAGTIVLPKDDEWRDEDEWDNLFPDEEIKPK